MREIYGKMQKKAMSRIWLGLVFAVLGVVFLLCGQNLMGYLTAKENAFDVESNAFVTTSSGSSTVEKMYTFKGNMFLDWYGNDDEGYYYIMPTVDNKFMGCFVYNQDKAIADQIVEQYQDYIIGERESEPDVFLTGKGYVYYMKDKEQQYFKEYMQSFFDAAGIANAEDYLEYKTFVVAPMSEVINGSDFVIAILGVVFAVIGICYVISFFLGGYKSQPKKYIANYGISESELASDLTYAIHKKNIDIGRQYAMVYGQTSYLIPYSQLLWTYVHITQTKHRTYGIPTGTTYTYQVFFAMRDGKKYNLVVKSEDEGQEIVKDICEMAPHVIGGYHEDLDQMFSKDVNQVIRIVEEHKAELASKAADEATAAASEDAEAASRFDDGFDPAAYTGSTQGSGLDSSTFGAPSDSNSSF